MFHREGPSLVELVHQGLVSTRRGYDMLAPRFEYTPFRTPDDVLEPVVSYLGEGAPYANALDVCCGTGAATAAIRPLCDAVTGVDFSPGMLAVAGERLGDDPGVSWVLADVFDLDLEGAFDLVVSFGAFGHVVPERQERFLEVVRRALRPGGRFVFVTAPVPPITSPVRWAAESFNLTMRVRNRLIKPEFIMYYLTFMLPDVLTALEGAGFAPEVHPLGLDRAPRARIVDARAL